MRNKFEREMNELADKLVTMSDFCLLYTSRCV